MYKRQGLKTVLIEREAAGGQAGLSSRIENYLGFPSGLSGCLLYTSDAADERSSVDLGGRRIIKKKIKRKCGSSSSHHTTIALGIMMRNRQET